MHVPNSGVCRDLPPRPARRGVRQRVLNEARVTWRGVVNGGITGVRLDVTGIDGVAAVQSVPKQLPRTRLPGRRPARRIHRSPKLPMRLRGE